AVVRRVAVDRWVQLRARPARRGRGRRPRLGGGPVDLDRLRRGRHTVRPPWPRHRHLRAAGRTLARRSHALLAQPRHAAAKLRPPARRGQGVVERTTRQPDPRLPMTRTAPLGFDPDTAVAHLRAADPTLARVIEQAGAPEM